MDQISVLIVDDQRCVRQGLKALLTLSPQVRVIGEAVDGQEAIRFVAERRPDLVLMDVQMPEMDGLEATQRIKSRWPEVRVIILTTCNTYRAKALATGADAFLLKDCASQALQNAISSPYTVSNHHGQRVQRT